MTADISHSLYCLALAAERDLPDTTYQYSPDKEKFRRPNVNEIDVYSFPQTWSNTALGFGGVGGQALTTAQTTVCIHDRAAAVYFNRRLAYVVPLCQELMDDVRNFNMAEVAEAGKYLKGGS